MNNDAILLNEFIDKYIVFPKNGIGFLYIRVDNYKLYLYPNDHNPPHIHVISKDIKFSITISNSQIIAGEASYNKLRKEARKMILNYISENRTDLQNEWDKIN